jgi:SPP1 gp7 family putative phage head morphogenesis protein
MSLNRLNSKIGRQYVPLSEQVTSLQVRMASQDIANWKRAIDDARNVLTPRRRRLYELYDIIGLDGHLTAVMNKRKISVTNQRVHFNQKGSDGVVNESVRDYILETPWFYKTIGHLCESKPYGHSLVELIPDKGFIKNVDLFPRANVKPETQFIMWDVNDESTGILYREDKTYSKYMIEMGAKKDYGLLMVAAQYVIYKRGGFGDWAQFAELFGMPFREAQYEPWDLEGRSLLEESLREMGGAGHVVTPKGTTLKFHDNNGTGKSEVFKDLIDACNAEISKIFLGNTMTTDNGSSRSQGEVHKQVEQDINLADIIEMEYLLNWELADRLRIIGYQVPDGRFFYPQMQDVPLEKRIEIDVKLSEKIDIAPDYWYNTYGIPKPGTSPVVLPPKKDDEKEEETPVEVIEEEEEGQVPVKKKRATAKKVTARYKADACCPPVVTAEEYTLTPEEDQLIEAIYTGNKDGYDPATFLQQINRLKEGLWSVLPPSAEYGSSDHVAATMMEVNLNEFGYDKSLATVMELNKLLDNDQTFSQFKARANTLLKTYNHHYLKAEYDFAIATAQNAANWNRQKANADIFPYVKYMTAGDDRVRAAHAALDGKVFRVRDDSWQAIYPPNGWNCRCEVISLANVEEENTIDGSTAFALLGKEYNKMKANGFALNRGELNVVFDLAKGYRVALSERPTPNYQTHGYKASSEIRATKESIGNLLLESSRDEVLRYVKDNETQFGKSKGLLYTDYAGRQLFVDYKKVDKHVKVKYDEENRQGFFWLIDKAISKPDEVWAFQYSENSYQYRYIKHYKEHSVVVVAEIQGGVMMLETWYPLRDDREILNRSGYRIK